MSSDVATLVDLIARSAAALAPIAASLDEPIDRSIPDPAPDAIPAPIFEALATLQAAANSLCDLLLPAKLVMLQNSMLYHIPRCAEACSALTISAIRIAMHASVAEILRDQPNGLDIADIARPSGISPRILERSLRLLATRNVFREVRPGVFATNKLGSVLDTTKSLDVVFGGCRRARWTDVDPFAAVIAHDVDEAFPAAAHLVDAFAVQPDIELPATVAMPRGTGFPTFWELLEDDADGWRSVRFCCAMQSTCVGISPRLTARSLGVSGALPRVYDWSKLSWGPIVDVGGADGSAMVAIRAVHPNVKAIIQDRRDVATAACKWWAENDPRAIKSGHVEVQISNFLEEQHVLNASAFFLRYILHDLSDAESVKVLTHLREAATPHTKLFIAENVIINPCGAPDRDGRLVGLGLPAPILPNGGYAASLTHCLDHHMMSILTGRERTLDSFDELLRVSGWRLKATHDLVHLSPFKLIEAEPASLKPIALQHYAKANGHLTVEQPEKRLRRPVSSNGRLGAKLRDAANKVAEAFVPKVIKVDSSGAGSDKSMALCV